MEIKKVFDLMDLFILQPFINFMIIYFIYLLFIPYFITYKYSPSESSQNILIKVFIITKLY